MSHVLLNDLDEQVQKNDAEDGLFGSSEEILRAAYRLLDGREDAGRMTEVSQQS